MRNFISIIEGEASDAPDTALERIAALRVSMDSRRDKFQELKASLQAQPWWRSNEPTDVERRQRAMAVLKKLGEEYNKAEHTLTVLLRSIRGAGADGQWQTKSDRVGAGTYRDVYRVYRKTETGEERLNKDFTTLRGADDAAQYLNDGGRQKWRVLRR